MSAITALLGDITAQRVDAIVNAANPWLQGGGGVDGAIHLAGGPSILEECQAIMAGRDPLAPGDVEITGAGLLPAEHVLHTVGPVWGDEPAETQDRQLAACHARSIRVASDMGCRTLAFPNISTGVYGFPKDRAARVAVAAVRDALAIRLPIEEVRFVCFGRENLDLITTEIGGAA